MLRWIRRENRIAVERRFDDQLPFFRWINWHFLQLEIAETNRAQRCNRQRKIDVPSFEILWNRKHLVFSLRRISRVVEAKFSIDGWADRRVDFMESREAPRIIQT